MSLRGQQQSPMPQEPEFSSYSSLKIVWYQSYKTSLEQEKKTGEIVVFKNYINIESKQQIHGQTCYLAKVQA